jgi:general secretion pathway protein N
MRLLALAVGLGALLGLVLYAPAAWLARLVQQGSGERLLLADARGTLWNGSAVPVLTGGAGSRDASALPGRLHWRIRPQAQGLGLGLLVQAEQACCLNGALQLRVQPGWNQLRVELLPAPGGGALGQWPAAWLAGLGTPWNTLQPRGSVQLASPGLVLESAAGRWRFDGRADIELNAFASRLSTLDVLGSYRLTVQGDAANNGSANLGLVTTSGALLLSGSGQLTGAGSGVRFRGTASAAPGSEAVLNNLLNIIGRRQGAQALITIG